jgi:site-specific DNA-methyltransferase (adenine-specific)
MISEVTNEDCMIMMARYPDKFFDLAIVDPPYGIDFGSFNRTNKDPSGNRFKANKYKNGKWDEKSPERPFFCELRRVSNFQVVWGGNYFFEILGNAKGLICWYKKQPVSNFSDCEYAWTNIDKPARVFEFAYYGNLEGRTSASEKIHPTQKPIPLYNWILNNYGNEGDKILDTHLGSGSSRIAAYKLGFDFWGCELDKDYFDAAEKRFKEAINEPLFQTQPEPKQSKIFDL